MTEPWLERWAEGRIGWHEADGNAALKQYWNVTGKRVLVPMCGKSVDLIWLAAQGNEVVGVELSDIAAQALFRENGLEAERDGKAYRAIGPSITIHCGDYFNFDCRSFACLSFDAPFDACYDRAALIALPSSMRPAYVKKTDSLLSPDAYRLLITVEYDPSVVDGPPYSVPGREVRSYWPALEKIASNDDLENSPPRFREAGLEAIQEVVWRTPNAA